MVPCTVYATNKEVLIQESLLKICKNRESLWDWTIAFTLSLCFWLNVMVTPTQIEGRNTGFHLPPAQSGLGISSSHSITQLHAIEAKFRMGAAKSQGSLLQSSHLWDWSSSMCLTYWEYRSPIHLHCLVQKVEVPSQDKKAEKEDQRLRQLPLLKQRWHSKSSAPLSLPPAPELWLRNIAQVSGRLQKK